LYFAVSRSLMADRVLQKTTVFGWTLALKFVFLAPEESEYRCPKQIQITAKFKSEPQNIEYRVSNAEVKTSGNPLRHSIFINLTEIWLRP
jgi:hypothetical protein